MDIAGFIAGLSGLGLEAGIVLFCLYAFYAAIVASVFALKRIRQNSHIRRNSP